MGEVTWTDLVQATVFASQAIAGVFAVLCFISLVRP